MTCVQATANNIVSLGSFCLSDKPGEFELIIKNKISLLLSYVYAEIILEINFIKGERSKNP